MSSPSGNKSPSKLTRDSRGEPVSPQPLQKRTSMSSDRSLNSVDTTASLPRSGVLSSASPPFRSSSANINRIAGGNARRQLMFSNFANMSETALPWTSRDIGMNAISGVLNDPNARKTTAVPKKGDIQPVPRTHIRKVKMSEFEDYMKSVGPIFQRYHLNKKLSRKNAPTTEDSVESSQGSSDSPSPLLLPPSENGLPRRRSSGDSSLLETVPSLFYDPDFNLENPSTFEAVCERADIVRGTSEDPPAAVSGMLQEKLSHYLDIVEVHLIQEISHRSASFFTALSNLQALHHETSECIGQIHTLRREMARISEEQAKQGLEVVRSKVRRANVAALRRLMQTVAELQLTLPTVNSLLQQGDYFGAIDLIDEAARLYYGIPTHQEGGERNGVGGALLEEIGEGSSDPEEGILADVAGGLQRVTALASFDQELEEMRQRIGTMMEDDLQSILLSDLQRHLAMFDPASGVQQLVSSQPISDTNADFENVPDREQALKELLSPTIVGLLRLNRLSTAFVAYRQLLAKEIRHLIRKQYPPSFGAGLDEDQEKEEPGSQSNEQISQFGKQIKSMSFDAFFNMLLSIYAVVLEVVRRTRIHHEIIFAVLVEADKRGVASGLLLSPEAGLPTEPQDTLAEIPENGLNSLLERATKPSPASSAMAADIFPEPSLHTDSKSDAPSPFASPMYSQLAAESSDIVLASADFSQFQCAKLVGIRANQTAQLNPTDFYRLFAVTWTFIGRGEDYCKRTCFGLRGAILSQAKAFLNHFHMEKMKQESLLIENEQWMQAEVPVDFQQIVDQIIAASATGATDFVEESAPELQRTQSPTANAEEGQADVGGKEPGKRQASRSNRFLVVNGQNSYVVGCSLLLIKAFADYLQCLVRIPPLSQDIVQRLVELLSMFNSRVCQVILGAGAMRSAGLKNITAKHLALASQSLGATVALIPFIKEFIRHHLPPGQAGIVLEFDRIAKDFCNHQSEIHAKLVSIMNERMTLHCRSLQATGFDQPDPKQKDNAPSAYMEVLVKETLTLHKVLSKYLGSEHLRVVMSEVFASFERRLSEEFARIEVYTPAGKERIAVDAEYFVSKLSSLEGVDPPGRQLVTIAQNVAVKPLSSPPSSSTSTSRLNMLR
ncbi:uncharacterized protein VTP21DRAFT_1968 [Calcarisporiella thermophila]|uniref:uncharacterized protein n=1 Tax=Calcarisporiella thermophila TaxID=911321 RepID=UPI003743C106